MALLVHRCSGLAVGSEYQLQAMRAALPPLCVSPGLPPFPAAELAATVRNAFRLPPAPGLHEFSTCISSC